MKIFVQLYIIFLIINPMVMESVQGPAVQAAKPTFFQSASNMFFSRSKKESIVSPQASAKTTVRQDAQTGKTGSSITELQGKDQQTGNPTSGKTDAQEGLALSDKASVTNESTSIQSTSSVAPLDTANMKDSVEAAKIQQNPTSKQSNKEVNKSLQAKPQATQSFVSEIAWSKLIPTKTITKTASKATSSAVDMTSNLFKDVSLTFKEKIAGKELSSAEQDFAARNERMQIQKVSKQINKITSNIKEKEMQLKQSEQELKEYKERLPQAEKKLQDAQLDIAAKKTQLTVEEQQVQQKKLDLLQQRIKGAKSSIAQHKKDIVQLKQTIAQQKQQKISLQEQQTKLMADKFNDRGELIVKSDSAQVEPVIVSPMHSVAAAA